jgi:hypothetical protein
VFAVGYAYSAALAPLRVADFRVPKAGRKAHRGRTCERTHQSNIYPPRGGCLKITHI